MKREEERPIEGTVGSPSTGTESHVPHQNTPVPHTAGSVNDHVHLTSFLLLHVYSASLGPHTALDALRHPP